MSRKFSFFPSLIGPAQDEKRRLRAAAFVSLFVLHVILGLAGWDFNITYDGQEYLQMAGHLLEDGHYSYDGSNPVVGKPPGFPFLLAAYIGITGSLDGFQHLQVLILFLTFLLVAAATSRLAGPDWALGVLALLVFTDPLRGLAYNLLSEPSFFLLTSIGMYAAIRLWDSRRFRWGLVCGLAFGISAYFRPPNLFWPLALLLFFWLADRKRLRWGVLVLAIHIMTVTPWIVRNAIHFDRFVPMVSNWALLYYMTDDHLYQILHAGGVADVMKTPVFQELLGDDCQFNWEPSERFRVAAMERMRSDFPGYLRRCTHQALFAWTFIPGTRYALTSAPGWFLIGRLAMLTFYAVIAVGVVTLWRRQRMLVFLFAGYAVYTAGVLFPVRTESRYLITPYLWLLPLAVTGTQVLWSKIRVRFGSARFSDTQQPER